MVDLIREEALAAREALPELSDNRVDDALRRMRARLREARDAVLTANAADCESAAGRLDEGALDRLRLSEERLDDFERQLEALADLPPLDRVIESWELPNGLRVSAHKIPIGVVGANFEARPNVALDVAGQLLKSLNACVLRTGSAALGTVTALVDDVVRPSLEAAGIPGAAAGLVRTPDRGGAQALAAMPDVVPLVILRGSGETTRELARHAATNGVQVLAHAEGGGVLYVDASADQAKAEAIVSASIDRLGVCNRLNLLLVHNDLAERLPRFVDLLSSSGITCYGTERARDHAQLSPLEQPIGHEWANDSANVASVTVDIVESPDAACTIANRETSGLAAGVVAEDTQVVERFFEAYRGTAAFWHATTRFTDGFALTGAPETGINVGWAPGPRGPVTYRDLWLRQVRVVGDATQHR
jgi:glutamate-5-semialdehyde dehydrogenase